MSIRITEKGRGRRRPAAASFVIATSPPVPRGGLRPQAKQRPKQKQQPKKSKAKRRNGNGRTNGLCCLDAFSKHNLGLPRAVGDYTYVTTIDNITIAGAGREQLYVFTPFCFLPDGSQGLNFSSNFAYSSEGANPAGSTDLYIQNDPETVIRLYNSKAIADAMLAGVELVPAAYSVRITCPSPMQTAKGQFFLGKWNIAADPREYDTYKALADGFMSYGQPRPLTAARLAMRGVQCDAMPRNMSDCSQFLHAAPNSASGPTDIQPYPFSNATGTWSGFSPIFLVVEESTTSDTTLNVQIAIKWRYRFSAVNPACKTHAYQPVVSDAIWNDVSGAASALGHGVKAIAEKGEEVGGDIF
jgi:hypothetical protein